MVSEGEHQEWLDELEDIFKKDKRYKERFCEPSNLVDTVASH